MKAGWQVVPLGEVASFVMGQAPPGAACNFDGNGTPFVKAGEFGADRPIIREWTTDPKKFAKSTDVLICVVGATCGKINLGAECAIGRSVAAIRPQPNSLDQFFLHYFLEGQVLALRGGSLGAAQTVISKDMLADLPISLPPLDEQKRIVAVLDEAFEGLSRARANAEANLADARDLFAVQIEELILSSGGVSVSLEKLIEDGAIVSHFDGNHGENYPRKEEFTNEGVPYLSANCLVDNEVDFSRAKFIPDRRAGTLKKGTSKDRDVLFAHNATVGPVALLRTHLPRVLLSTSLTHYRCNEEAIIPEFLLVEMQSAAFVRQYETVMRQATRNQVPISAQRKFTHIVPPLNEQKRIAEISAQLREDVSDLVRAYGKTAFELDTLRQSLLQKAFSGELT